ncbi:isoprenylcysteine carboxylmethyltransferase family protein [Cocleimonas flava]|uniref:Protein-S-isoprenylcysteine O-methyltransferase Ste14 n=1 Tax=Cocleimonas flava TaxID=634765 RepID=A0A4R1EXX3_9GAMM|nr:protein-S-isoprenylcysteine O-methyltransferase Ste14 [Cocleimonas flava]
MLQLKIPPPVYAISIAILMWLLSKYMPVAEIIQTPWNKIGLVIIVIAVSFDVWSLLLFLKKKTTPNPMKPENTSGIVTKGLYQYSRNPMYLGMLIILFGFGIWLGSLSPFIMLPAFYWVITEMQIKPEERMLEQKFTNEYLDYKNRVRRWL